MPASGLTWSPSRPERGQVFQVFGQFGTKRKADDEDEQSWDMEMGQHVQQMQFMGAKRLCVQTAPEFQHSQHQHPQHLQQQQHLQQHPQHLQQQPSHPEVDMGMASSMMEAACVQPGANMTWLQRAKQTPQQHSTMNGQPDMFPNCVPRPLDDSFCNQQSAAQLSEACMQEMATDTDMMSMESDFIPDPSQYTALPAATATLEVPPNAPQQTHTGLNADTSVSRGARVRCFCKPTWEGVMSMRPYISDIY